MAKDAFNRDQKIDTKGALGPCHRVLRGSGIAYARYQQARREYVETNLTLGAHNAGEMVAGSARQIRLQTTMTRLVSHLP